MNQSRIICATDPMTGHNLVDPQRQPFVTEGDHC